MKKRRYILVRLYPASPAQMEPIRAAVEALGAAWDGVQPAELFQVRRARDGRQAIFEVTCHEAEIAAGVAESVAARLSPAGVRLRDVAEMTVFDEKGSLDGSRAACSAYLLAHAEEWEDPV